MCQTIRRPGDTLDTEICTTGQLRALWPDLVPDPRYGRVSRNPALCLCQVDVAASAAANGAAVRRDERHPSVWRLDVRDRGRPG